MSRLRRKLAYAMVTSLAILVLGGTASPVSTAVAKPNWVCFGPCPHGHHHG